MQTIVVRVLPVVYPCSGCSSVAVRFAHHAARRLDQLGVAEMSYMPAAGADEAMFAAKVKSRSPVIVIDGCALGCARRWLARHGVEPARHYDLTDFGVEDGDFDPVRAESVVQCLTQDL